MQKTLAEIKLSEILPEVLARDDVIFSAAKAISVDLNNLTGEIEKVLHLPRLNFLSAEMLDYLAWQYHVDNYAEDFSPDIKRNMIRQSIFLHRIKGTTFALKLALSAFSRAEISEWNEYGGKPYFFKLLFRRLRDLGDDGESLMHAIYENKNVRSWIEDITFDFTDEILDKEEVYNAILEACGGLILTDIYFPENISDDEKIICAQTELFGGNIATDIYRPENISETHYTFSPILEMCGGFEITDCVLEMIEPEDNFDPDALRLYFVFSDYTYRVLSVCNPKPEVSADEINSLSDFSAAEKVLINSRGKYTLGIDRAILRQKVVYNVL